MKKQKIIIGRVDRVDLPDLEIFGAQAKIDTGAYTSSIHCHKIKQIDDQLSFYIQIEIDGKLKQKKFATSKFSQKIIKSSNGASSLRYVIKTKILLFGKAYDTEFSLTDRSTMKNPILLGRKLLNKRFLVDVSQKHLSFNMQHKS